MAYENFITESLRPFVRSVWISNASQELALPTGEMHIVIRLSDQPVRLISPQPGHYSHAVVGGNRESFYLREAPPRSRSIGVQLQPGAAQWLLGARADELANRHTPLEDLWGSAAADAREQLLECTSAQEELAVFQSILLARVPRVRGLHPAVAEALATLTPTCSVQKIAAHSGYSHRRFIELFHQAIGLTPKTYCRVLRFQQAVKQLSRMPLADVAASAGYSDQAHLTREFRHMAGVTPAQYRARTPG